MPGRLKSFELHGYKTFATRTEFMFADGVTAIVGPNGSGKSNIADAIRWVLGEQSFGLLRAKKTEDMIFAGSENRSRAGMASATIVFDNSDGWLPIDFSEVGITRRAYRAGDNEYLLNGQRVRLKDVTELLAESGLAERTYTVIGQGLVDAALSLKAEERRRLFEEAAGIGLHRSRRDETLRRLDATRRNLERVQDILAEILPRLRSLERQAQRAQEYDRIRLDLKNLLREWYGYHWHQSLGEITELTEIARQQEVSLDKARQHQLGLDQKLAELRDQSMLLRTKIAAYNERLAIAYSQKEHIARKQATNYERTRSLQEQCSSVGKEITQLREEISYYEQQVTYSSDEVDELTLELNQAKEQSSIVVGELTLLRQNFDSIDREVKIVRNDLTELATKKSILQSKISERQLAIARLIKANEESLKTSEESKASYNQALGYLTAVNEKQEASNKRIVDIEEKLISIRRNIEEIDSKRQASLKQLSQCRSDMDRRKSQLDVLQQAEDSLSGYADGARILLKALRDSRITAGRGALSQYIDVEPEYERAITSALGEYLSALVVGDWKGIQDALEILEAGSARGALIPMDNLSRSRPWAIDFSKFPGDKGSIFGIASQLVNVANELRPIIDLLLGQVVIVKDRDTARKLLTESGWTQSSVYKLVTLQGEIFHSNGPVLSAFSGQGILARPRQQKDLQKEISVLTQEESSLSQLLDVIEGQLNEARVTESILQQEEIEAKGFNKHILTEFRQAELSVEKTQRMVDWHQEQIKKNEKDILQSELEVSQLVNEMSVIENNLETHKLLLKEKSQVLANISLEELQTSVAYWQTQIAVNQRALGDAEGKRNERMERLSRNINSLNLLQSRFDQMLEELNTLENDKISLTESFSELTNQIDTIQNQQKPTEIELGEVEKALSHWIHTDSEARQALSNAEHHYAQARINLSRRQETLDSLRRRIEDDFGLVAFDYVDAVSGPKPLPLDGMVEELPHIITLPVDLEENVQRLRALLRRMGPVNPEAQIEYKQVKERYEFLTEQVSDLNKAENDIQEVISELDTLMEREFRKTFDAVALEFRQIFTRLFGGGSAKLVLTDPDFMTDTGIDIEARLPGRREQGLSLLSGGERSLTAVALVFALLRISPTPFCILDEVDAMLDEANVGRFRELLEELSEHTQFIIITHNRNTVQAASVIYGVTMSRDSASQVISLKLDELTEEYGVQKNR